MARSYSLLPDPSIAAAQPRMLPRRWPELFGDARRWLALLLALSVVIVALGWAFFPDVFAPQSPFQTHVAWRLRPPSAAHWFGTDYLGRDVYARVVHGAALSLKATVIAVSLGLAAGCVLGLLAGFSGRAVDDAVMRIVDVLLAIPSLLLSLMVVTVLGFGTVNVALAVGVATIATFARVMRAEVLRIKAHAYIEAAFGSGQRWFGVLRRHVLPNAAGPVLVLAGLEFGSAILSVSALSFLGFGAAPPAPEWGTLVAEGRNYLVRAWWLTAMPGAVIILVVLSTNSLGKTLERLRTKGSR
ncbi:ABC transporter permease [Achromobacter seleniivolatilans]|uniref:ABC transporter permease n=1 Tax=Achromobacter seleniivolatilans TaxID=3047478 RepID=A0ABY9M5C1_9BURK|nr:ABC transporter permease [Achromobacter sp. R39]WMD22194.1 ABC transporter permease [Achromobacter sp. R39]